MVKTTKKQFRLFRDEFKRCVKQFGLVEWRLDIFHEEVSKGTIAEIQPQYNERAVFAKFGIESNRELSDAFILETAKHEAIELLVSDICDIAQARYVTVDEIASTRHTLVRRLEKLL